MSEALAGMVSGMAALNENEAGGLGGVQLLLRINAEAGHCVIRLTDGRAVFLFQPHECRRLASLLTHCAAEIEEVGDE